MSDRRTTYTTSFTELNILIAALEGREFDEMLKNMYRLEIENLMTACRLIHQKADNVLYTKSYKTVTE